MSGTRSPSRIRRAALVVCLSTACALVTTMAAPPVGAASDAGASSRVVGRGDIVTSILGWTSPGRRPSRRSAPRCAWRTLTDAQLEWLVSVAAQAVALGLHTPLLDPLAPHLAGDELPDGDLQGYVCGTATHELRFVPSATPRTTTEVVQRWMITHLPAPDPQMTPTPGVAVPLGVPVFVTIPAAQWQPVDATLSHAGTTAEVRAAPVSLRVIPGDPAAATVECDGPGIGYRSGHPIAEQAEAAGACVLRYRTATRGGTSPRRGPEAASSRPPLWLGTVTVVWEASWRVDGGPWRDLGPVPRTRLVTRAAREVTTSVETPR